MPGTTDNGADAVLVARYIASLSGRAWGIALGLLAGMGLFLATNVLVLAGGEDIGQHLGLLSHYFPFYEVSFVGSLIGFGYAFVVGYAVGRLICFVYARTAHD